MAQVKRRKARKGKKKSHRNGQMKGRSNPQMPEQTEIDVARSLDQVVQAFDHALDSLQNSLERLREVLPHVVALDIRRDRSRRIRTLAEDGILDSLQRLASILDASVACGELPGSLAPHHRSARMAVYHICRTFEVLPVYQPGESLTITQEQAKDFDWSADTSRDVTFPAYAEILRSGWKAGDTVLAVPRVGVCQAGACTMASTRTSG
jgi:hypothetical protein